MDSSLVREGSLRALKTTISFNDASVVANRADGRHIRASIVTLVPCRAVVAFFLGVVKLKRTRLAQSVVCRTIVARVGPWRRLERELSACGTIVAEWTKARSDDSVGTFKAVRACRAIERRSDVVITDFARIDTLQTKLAARAYYRRIFSVHLTHKSLNYFFVPLVDELYSIIKTRYFSGYVPFNNRHAIKLRYALNLVPFVIILPQVVELYLLRVDLENISLANCDADVLDPGGKPTSIVTASTLVVKVSRKLIGCPTFEIRGIRVDQTVFTRCICANSFEHHTATLFTL